MVDHSILMTIAEDLQFFWTNPDFYGIFLFYFRNAIVQPTEMNLLEVSCLHTT